MNIFWKNFAGSLLVPVLPFPFEGLVVPKQTMENKKAMQFTWAILYIPNQLNHKVCLGVYSSNMKTLKFEVQNLKLIKMLKF